MSLTMDPISLEVLNMRLQNIVEEMSIALMRSSGSNIITESADLNTAIFDREGEVLAYSDFIQLHTGSGSVAVKNLLKAIANTDVYPGDAFISNDPHTSGSTHPPDVSVISPIFHKGEVVAWAQSQAHLLDIGGMTPGGFANAAKDNISEGLLLPPGVKFYEKGKPVEAVKKIILNNVRLPINDWNDIRSLIASNNTGIKRMTETLNEYGLERFWFYTQKSIELTEKVIRQRLANIPDGVYEAEEWVEHNGHVNELFRIHCRMEVNGDEMTLDFSNSSKQTNGYINCSFGALIGSIVTSLWPSLAWDLSYNSGILKPITIIAEKGTIVNPIPPAPVSGGHTTTGVRVSRVLTKVFNLAFPNSSDPMLSNRMQGQWGESGAGVVTAGIDDSGEFFVYFPMDCATTAAGAQYNVDGLDCSGLMMIVNNTIADVESNELTSPVLYLWRKMDPNSCGPGYFRGGQGLNFAWILWGAEEAQKTVFAPTAQVPAEGYGGGYPGGGTIQTILRGTNIEELLKTGQFPDSSILTSKEPVILELNDNSYLKKSEVYIQKISGGGGFGDPLLRPIDKVQYDVNNNLVTREIAEAAYGVIFVEDTIEIDKKKTNENRRNIRAKRINKPAASVPDIQLNDLLEGNSIMVKKEIDDTYVCKQCGTNLGSEKFELTKKDEYPIAKRLQSLGVRVRAREEEPAVYLVEQFCQGCGTAVRVTVKVGN